jgi:hypothetical protein
MLAHAYASPSRHSTNQQNQGERKENTHPPRRKKEKKKKRSADKGEAG